MYPGCILALVISCVMKIHIVQLQNKKSIGFAHRQPKFALSLCTVVDAQAEQYFLPFQMEFNTTACLENHGALTVPSVHC